MKYDVIIIGAGPAGLMTGRTLNNKCNFLIIDSKKEIGLPLKCGEGVRKEVIDSFFRERNFVKNCVNIHEIRLRNYKRVEKCGYYKIDRTEFEKYLAESIRKKIILNTKLIDVNIKKNYAEVITNRGKFICELVIIAYGANFKLQRKFNLIKKRINLMPCYGGLYKNCKLDSKKFIFDFYTGKTGYFWIFPENNKIANIGIGLNSRMNVKKDFLHILKNYSGLRNSKPLTNYSSIIPCSGPINRTYYDRMLFCGDAAGFVLAGTGEGIVYALKSGKIAAEIALESWRLKKFNKKFLKIYEKSWKKEFGNELKGGLIFYDLILFASKHKLLKKLFGAASSKELHYIARKGKFPLRAMVLWRIIKLFNL